jgi:hypothetical protein
MSTNFITQFFYEVWGTVNGQFTMLRKCTTYLEANEYANSVKFYSPIIKAIR